VRNLSSSYNIIDIQLYQAIDFCKGVTWI